MRRLLRQRDELDLLLEAPRRRQSDPMAVILAIYVIGFICILIGVIIGMGGGQ